MFIFVTKEINKEITLDDTYIKSIKENSELISKWYQDNQPEFKSNLCWYIEYFENDEELYIALTGSINLIKEDNLTEQNDEGSKEINKDTANYPQTVNQKLLGDQKSKLPTMGSSHSALRNRENT